MNKLINILFVTIFLFSMVICHTRVYHQHDSHVSRIIVKRAINAPNGVHLFEADGDGDDDDPDFELTNQYACEACKDISCLQNEACQPDPEYCNQYQEYGILDDDAKQVVLKKHNELRNKVANGDQMGQPSASNMNELVWDDELANMAQCFANDCQFEHVDCNFTDGRDDGFGQNVDVYEANYQMKKDELGFEGDVQDWYNEVNSFPSELVSGYKDGGVNGKKPDGGDYGHYTQLVWAESKMVGCGSSLYFDDDEKLWTSLLICNYYPPGNYEDEPLYEQGEPASSCENGPSDNYPALCKN